MGLLLQSLLQGVLLAQGSPDAVELHQQLLLLQLEQVQPLLQDQRSGYLPTSEPAGGSLQRASETLEASLPNLFHLELLAGPVLLQTVWSAAARSRVLHLLLLLEPGGQFNPVLLKLTRFYPLKEK